MEHHGWAHQLTLSILLPLFLFSYGHWTKGRETRPLLRNTLSPDGKALWQTIPNRPPSHNKTRRFHRAPWLASQAGCSRGVSGLTIEFFHRRFRPQLGAQWDACARLATILKNTSHTYTYTIYIALVLFPASPEGSRGACRTGQGCESSVKCVCGL